MKLILLPSLILITATVQLLSSNIYFYTKEEYSVFMGLYCLIFLLSYKLNYFRQYLVLWIFSILLFSFFINMLLQANFFISNAITSLSVIIVLLFRKFKDSLINILYYTMFLFLFIHIGISFFDYYRVTPKEESETLTMQKSPYVSRRIYSSENISKLIGEIKDNYIEKSAPLEFKVKPNVYILFREGVNSIAPIETHKLLYNRGLISKKKLDKEIKKYIPFQRYLDRNGFKTPGETVGYYIYTEPSAAGLMALGDVSIPRDPGGFPNLIFHFYNPVFQLFKDNGYKIYSDFSLFSLGSHKTKISPSYIEQMYQEFNNKEYLYDYFGRAIEDSSGVEIEANRFITAEIFRRFSYGLLNRSIFQFFKRRESSFLSTVEDRVRGKNVIYKDFLEESLWDKNKNWLYFVYLYEARFEDKYGEAVSWDFGEYGQSISTIKGAIDHILERDSEAWIFLIEDHNYSPDYLWDNTGRSFNNYVMFSYRVPDPQFEKKFENIKTIHDTFPILLNSLSGENRYKMTDETYIMHPGIKEEIKKLSELGEIEPYFLSKHWTVD